MTTLDKPLMQQVLLTVLTVTSILGAMVAMWFQVTDYIDKKFENNWTRADHMMYADNAQERETIFYAHYQMQLEEIKAYVKDFGKATGDIDKRLSRMETALDIQNHNNR